MKFSLSMMRFKRIRGQQVLVNLSLECFCDILTLKFPVIYYYYFIHLYLHYQYQIVIVEIYSCLLFQTSSHLYTVVILICLHKPYETNKFQKNQQVETCLSNLSFQNQQNTKELVGNRVQIDTLLEKHSYTPHLADLKGNCKLLEEHDFLDDFDSK